MCVPGLIPTPNPNPHCHKGSRQRSLLRLILTRRMTITFLQLWTLRHREVQSCARDHTTKKVSERGSSHLALLSFPIFKPTFPAHPVSENLTFQSYCSRLTEHCLKLFPTVTSENLAAFLKYGSFTRLKDTLALLTISAHYPSSKPNQKNI